MKHVVVWTADAESDLAELWMLAEDREAVVNASRRIDEILNVKELTPVNRAAEACGYCINFRWDVISDYELPIG